MYNKIGFLAGVGGNPTGIGDYVRALDAAGIPAVVFANDGTTGLSDLYALGEWNAPHVAGFRVVVDGSEAWSVPEYHLAPYEAAVWHWSKIRPLIPAEVVANRHRTWIFPINEVDKNKADWLGRFGVELATLANREGFKVAMFAWSSGEPEPDAWHTPGMLEYLHYCAAWPDRAAINLHEYSYEVDNIRELHPYRIGRFLFLHDVCDMYDIPRPSILIGEWGWTLDNVPAPAAAMADIQWGAELYAPHDNILGAGIWYLGPYNKSNIADKAQRLIAPVTDYSLAVGYVPPPIDPEEPPVEEKHTAIVVKLPQTMTAEEWNHAAAAAYPFRHTVTASHDDMLTILAGGNDRSYVKFTHPERDADSVALVEAAGYEWEPFYPEPEPPQLQVTVIVDDLPQHPTKTYATRRMIDITHLTIHHTVSPPDRSIESIAAYHVNSNGWPGIGYHFVIKADGRIFQTNWLETKSYHAGSSAPGDENLISVGIALQGDFTNQPPPQAQLDAARALVAHLRELLLSPLQVLGHRQMPGAATACPGATWAQWLPYVAGDDAAPAPAPAPAPTPPPPAAPTIDLVPYMFPAERRIYEVRHPDGSQERIQTQVVPGQVAYIVKGENQGFWERWSWDDQYIYLERDTSPGPDGVYYDVARADGRRTPWCPRHMRVGQQFSDGGHVVTFKNKTTCQPIDDVRSGSAANVTTLIDTFDRYQFDTGIALDDCILIRGNTEEHIFAMGYGRVGWSAPWGDSEVSEIHAPGARPDIVRETGCFGG